MIEEVESENNLLRTKVKSLEDELESLKVSLLLFRKKENPRPILSKRNWNSSRDKEINLKLGFKTSTVKL